MRDGTKRLALLSSALLLATIAAIEIVGRAIGVTDVPRYRIDRAVGYIPQARQAGSFLSRHPFAFNERSMGTARRFRPGPADILLLGDSVVIGSNWTAQPQRLGASLERVLHRRVWPIAANSWGLSNELALLETQPDLLKMRTLIVVSNEGDFGPPSVWRGAASLLDRSTPSIIWFLASPYFGRRANLPVPDPALATKWQRQLVQFLDHYRGCLFWVYYPNTNNLDYRLPVFAPLDRRIRGRAHRILVRGHRWNASHYRDSIHPTGRGDAVLAQIIAAEVNRISQADASGRCIPPAL